jgi:hypothetical protein
VPALIDKAYRWAIPVLGLWLALWILLSWAGVQDDAFIHLRYADNLFRTHLITYDGVHPDYGTSSLLYVYLLSFLRVFTASPDLPRIVSSCVHLLLIAGLVLLFLQGIPRESHLARLLGLTTLTLFVAPSAVRWLDDGMETGLTLCFAALLCWVIFRQSTRHAVTGLQYLAFALLGFFTVLQRTELLLLCGVSFVILAWQALFSEQNVAKPDGGVKALVSCSHLLLGGILALAFIRIKMHFLLPDTAVAKSSGVPIWLGTLDVTAKVLAGALSFGVGMLLFWLLTIFLLLRARRFTMTDLFANSVFPILLFLAALRGQHIQGVRYLVWTFCFSALWNILELGSTPPLDSEKQTGAGLAYCFLAVLLLALPYESKALYLMLRSRSTLLQQLKSDHLERFEGKRGIAFDVGLIGYFSRADICDLAGLVNGRERARETESERFAGCAASHPDFLFLDATRIGGLRPFLSFSDWQVCSHYDFRNVNFTNRHYLIVPRLTASEVCREVTNSVPSDVENFPH